MMTSGFSGNWHSMETLVCSDCHTIHNSQNGQPMRYDGAASPSPHLLRHADSLSLCLFCHDGSNAYAPDVIGPVAYTADPNGGFFENSGSISSEKGHDLNSSTPEIAPGGDDPLVLTCASCHNPHGTPNYRNLLENPPGSGNGADVPVAVSQNVLPDGFNPSSVYVPSNVIYKNGMSSWCNDCHQDFHGRSVSEEGISEPWLRHPQDEQISGSYGADYNGWSRAIVNRVEVESPLDEIVPSSDDKVFCLSCHKAHGSAYGSALIYTDGMTKVSTCQQCHYKEGLFQTTKHGEIATGVLRVTAEPRGDCGQCHFQHASYDGTPTGDPFEYALFTDNTNQLCYASSGAGPCHSLYATNKIYPGQSIYDLSSHSTSSVMVWPGPTPRARKSSEAGLCVNCHDPHGESDPSGLLPALTFQREEKLCYECHDASGPASADIKADATGNYAHPFATAGKHIESEDGDPSKYGITNRHAECEDCHNPHYAKTDTISPSPPVASERMKGVSRIKVTNVSAGTVPIYTYLPPDDQTQGYEYEVCFKCHSSWTTLPSGKTDAGLFFNDRNASYHPVENAGKNVGINANAFVAGWSPTSTIYCSDCHRSGNSDLEGPHGSVYRYILRAPYTASSQSRTMASDELCFLCHSYDTYANDSASDTVKGYSRWNPPQEDKGHTFHVEEKQRPCYACHGSHGSPAKSFLIAPGRNPGLGNFTSDGNGGTCSPTCHDPESYIINYPR